LAGARTSGGFRLGRRLPREANRLKERGALANCEIAPAAKRDASEIERTDADAPQALDWDPGRFHHPADNMINAFVKRDRENESFPRFAKDPELVRYDPFLFDCDTRPHPLHHRLGRPDCGDDLVFLVELVPRMHDSVRDVTIVCQKKQSLGVAVESTNWINPFIRLHEVHHRPAITLILHCRDVPRRLVKYDVARLLCAKALAVDSNVGVNWIGLRTKRGHDLAVDRHAAGRDHFLGLASRRDAARGENSLETFHDAVLSKSVSNVVVSRPKAALSTHPVKPSKDSMMPGGAAPKNFVWQ
jgi:hypothetical protein